MSRSFATTIAIGIALSSPASATLIRCKAVETSTPLNTGSLSDLHPWSKADLATGVEFSFDSASGLLRVHRREAGQSQPIRFEVIQAGSHQNDLVAVARRPCIVACPVDSLRVRVWQSPMTFMFVDSTATLYTGRCQN
ncbi:MAG: hypothetical protein ING19_02695 [Azospirillum sp.]|nr:hypothetical protein [Azospirillum sp.]